MHYFWTIYDNMTYVENPLGTFSIMHFLVLILCFIGTFYMNKIYARHPNRKAYRIALAWVIIAVIASRHLVEFVTGQYTVHRLPFHLCTVFAFMKLYDAYIENEFTKETIFILTMPAALLANIFPDWTGQPLINFNTWQQFIFHALLINYVMMRYTAGEIRPHIKKIWMPLISLLTPIPFIFLLNEILGTNFFFIATYSPGSPMEMLYAQFGPFYIFALGLAKVSVWLAVYGLVYLYENIKLKQRRTI